MRLKFNKSLFTNSFILLLFSSFQVNENNVPKKEENKGKLFYSKIINNKMRKARRNYNQKTIFTLEG